MKSERKITKDGEKRLMVLKKLPTEVLNFRQTMLGLSLPMKFKISDTKLKQLKEIIV